MRELAVEPCQALCSWQATSERLDGCGVFACAGCGSQWVRTQEWTPIDASGHVPAAVAAERAARLTGGGGGGGAGTEGTRRTSAP